MYLELNNIKFPMFIWEGEIKKNVNLNYFVFFFFFNLMIRNQLK